jgi:hypothetical protein
MWYFKVSKKATRKTLRQWRGKGLRCLFREYLSYTMGVGVVGGESAVGVPLRRLFRYEWMDVIRFALQDSIVQLNKIPTSSVPSIISYRAPQNGEHSTALQEHD